MPPSRGLLSVHRRRDVLPPRDRPTRHARGGSGAAWAVAICVLLVIGIGLDPGLPLERANLASQSARHFGPDALPVETAAHPAVAPGSDVARSNRR